jgi:hypothetical protein
MHGRPDKQADEEKSRPNPGPGRQMQGDRQRLRRTAVLTSLVSERPISAWNSKCLSNSKRLGCTTLSERFRSVVASSCGQHGTAQHSRIVSPGLFVWLAMHTTAGVQVHLGMFISTGGAACGGVASIAALVDKIWMFSSIPLRRAQGCATRERL